MLLILMNNNLNENTMKKIVFLFMISVSAFLSAQKNNDYHERVMALKTAFFTTELSLSQTEAEKFWPIYNAFENDFHRKKRHELRDIRKTLREKGSNLTDAEAETYLKQIFSIEKEILLKREEMNMELTKVISPKKVLMLQKAEYDFDRKMLQEYRNRRQGNND